MPPNDVKPIGPGLPFTPTVAGRQAGVPKASVLNVDVRVLEGQSREWLNAARHTEGQVDGGVAGEGNAQVQDLRRRR
ncbi:hypothetical protein GCM10028812_26170 [Ancylobacter sonchi]